MNPGGRIADGGNRVRGAHRGPRVAGQRDTRRPASWAPWRISSVDAVALDHNAVVVVLRPILLRLDGIEFVHRVDLVKDDEGPALHPRRPLVMLTGDGALWITPLKPGMSLLSPPSKGMSRVATPSSTSVVYLSTVLPIRSTIIAIDCANNGHACPSRFGPSSNPAGSLPSPSRTSTSRCPCRSSRLRRCGWCRSG